MAQVLLTLATDAEARAQLVQDLGKCAAIANLQIAPDVARRLRDLAFELCDHVEVDWLSCRHCGASNPDRSPKNHFGTGNLAVLERKIDQVLAVAGATQKENRHMAEATQQDLAALSAKIDAAVAAANASQNQSEACLAAISSLQQELAAASSAGTGISSDDVAALVAKLGGTVDTLTTENAKVSATLAALSGPAPSPASPPAAAPSDNGAAPAIAPTSTSTEPGAGSTATTDPNAPAAS